MTTPTNPTNDPFEEQLRQLLKAEADTVTTSPEALNLIRERTERNRGSIWFGLPWLRPALAVAGAGLIAASVIMSSPQVRDQVLEIVPAGADRQGTPPEEVPDGGVVPSTSSTDSAPGQAQQEQPPPPDPATPPSPEPSEEGSTAVQEDPEATPTCPAASRDDPSAPAGGAEEDAESAEEGCEPTGEPSTGTGGGDGGSGGTGGAGDGSGGDTGSGAGEGGREETGESGGGTTTGDGTTTKSEN
ncbi:MULTISPECIES: hypothetical protein [unclassified Nocardiopsis]|uniref:hypothetical protein n=1 Tax=unclassified Nocardiopsis TaxID=2649073 RepID=UPI001357E20A|nr:MULTISPECIES: hypothetical protein [unclassified Nocardiopsis]